MPSIKYVVVNNALTTPPSYYAQVEPRTILGEEEIAIGVNVLNPTVPLQVVKAVLSSFKEVVKTELANGNTVKIENFVSFRSLLKGSMVNATDPLPADAYQVAVTPSAPFNLAVKQETSFERTGVKAIAPTVAAVADTNTGIANLVREGFGLEIDGSRMGWDQTDTELGAFMISSNATTRQTNVSYNKAKRAIIIPNLDAGISSPNVEYELQIRNRFTENGQVRTGTALTKLRDVNITSLAGTNIEAFAVGAAAGPVSIDYAGVLGDAVFKAQISAQGVLSMSVGTIAGVDGAAVDMTADGAYVLAGLATDVTVTITYATLLATVLSYGRYMVEVCDLQALI